MLISSVVCVAAFLCQHVCHCRMGFKKADVHVEFPPQVQRVYTSSIPSGHLRPLGWQRQPDGKVTETAASLTPQEFHDKHVATNVPLVMRQSVSEVPAMTSWKSDEYIKQQYGELIVSVTVKKEYARKEKEKVKFKKFLREYEYEDWYLASIMPQEIMHEFAVPACLRCGYPAVAQQAELWMSSGGTASSLHSHAHHQLHCILHGRKDFILIDSQYKPDLHFTEKGVIHEDDSHSDIDVNLINMFLYQKVSEIPWHWSTLQDGDCIFIPAKHLHQVRSYGRSVSWTVVWAPSPSYPLNKCISKNSTLIDFDFNWHYVRGDKRLGIKEFSPSNLRHQLTMLMLDKPLLTEKVFKSFVQLCFAEHEYKASYKELNEMWKLLAGDKTSLTRDSVSSVPPVELHKICTQLNNIRSAIKSTDNVNTKDEL